jgi:2-C-methyl-D-erythritol 4-phosphate cytidylyltransferase
VFIFVTRSAAQRATIARLAAPLLGATAEVLFTLGGKERQDSVERGLRLVPEAVEYVFIHDCARPLVTPASLRALLAAVRRDDAAVLAHRATDTIKQTPPRPRGLRRLLLRDLRRDTLWAMETPQVFARELAQQAYLQVRQKKLRVTDDVAAVAALGHAVTLVENHAPNPKLTRPEDFAWAEVLVKSRGK